MKLRKRGRVHEVLSMADDGEKLCAHATLKHLLSEAPIPLSVPDICRRVRQMGGSSVFVDILGSASLLEEAVARSLRVCREASSIGRQYYFLRSRRDEMQRNCLVSPDYQRLGMDVHPTLKLKWIPRCAEGNFFEIQPSGIRGAGFGLFLRRGRQLLPGTIAAEYTGREVKVKQSSEFGTYVERLPSGAFLDALNGGKLDCFASLINDGGPAAANVHPYEFAAQPGRLFIVATKVIHSGDELFMTYGASYWGAESYSTVKLSPVTPRGHGAIADEAMCVCRTCRADLPRRAMALHKEWCCSVLPDLRDFVPHSVDSLPKVGLTAFDGTNQAGHARHYSNKNQALMLFHTHEDIQLDPIDSEDESERIC